MHATSLVYGYIPYSLHPSALQILMFCIILKGCLPCAANKVSDQSAHPERLKLINPYSMPLLGINRCPIHRAKSEGPYKTEEMGRPTRGFNGRIWIRTYFTMAWLYVYCECWELQPTYHLSGRTRKISFQFTILHNETWQASFWMILAKVSLKLMFYWNEDMIWAFLKVKTNIRLKDMIFSYT